MVTPVFVPPHSVKVILNRPVFVKGKGLPKDGIQLAGDGEEVTVYSDNGSAWYLQGHYKGKTIRIATCLHSL